MTTTKEFMLIFRYEANPNYQPTTEEITEMQKAWGGFIGKIAIQEKLVSTHRLGFSAKTISADQSVKDGMLLSEKQLVSGNMIVKAASLQEAINLAKACPILHAGGTVEVRDVAPM